MNDGPSASQCLKLEDHDCKNDQLPLGPEIVWDLLLHLDPYKSVRPDGMYPIILKILVHVITNPLSMIFEQSWEYGEVPADWKLVNVVPVLKKDKKEDA
ncbi:RNA-directed DNA polymerase from mobile element jockey [Willisornis vidua]|uniref:RNA-directed DNA polymerase from mobile element jockey n=1 Tax=Willisornis vidua TaxID=1566151 RepID=A0ABQ9DQ24_9PASS|nr:RNA-directed DNA polymerase from mobile element jockey [Willisornis vidua]